MASRYEYKVVEARFSSFSTKSTIARHEKLLTELDAQGWELVSTVAETAFVTYAALLYFRRPVSQVDVS